MSEHSLWLTATELAMAQGLDQFEARLAESSSLAFRVAYGVLRHREDAEDVAQEALTRAYRCVDQVGRHQYEDQHREPDGQWIGSWHETCTRCYKPPV